MTHDEYVETLKSTLGDMVVNTVVTAIATELPFLSWGPLKTVMTFLIRKLVEYMINQTELAIFLAYTDTRTNAQGIEFTNAAKANVLAQKEGTPEQKAQAEALMLEKFRAFARFKG